MKIQGYLAMTPGEMGKNVTLPPKIGYMACHFSPYGTGLSNLPQALPPGSLLIVNDRTPVFGHDPEVICGQLLGVVERLGCSGILLDFQRQGESETKKITEAVVKASPCPVGVTPFYGEDLDCPVFLPPVPPHIPLEEYLSPWKSREIWLECSLEGGCVTVTPKGSLYTPFSPAPLSSHHHQDSAIHCHYTITVEADKIQFHLYRTAQDLQELLKEAETLGITHAVGLYQELKDFDLGALFFGG